MRILTCLLTMSLLTGCNSYETPPNVTCPDWSDNASHNYSNKDFSNFGCAYYNNMSVQLANPDDLAKGHGEQVMEGDRESVNMQKYLTATPQILTSQSAPSTGSSGGGGGGGGGSR